MIIDNHMLHSSFNAFEPIMVGDECRKYDRDFYENVDGTEVEVDEAYAYAWQHMTDEERQESILYNDTKESIIEWFFSGGEWSLRKKGTVIW